MSRKDHLRRISADLSVSQIAFQAAPAEFHLAIEGVQVREGQPPPFSVQGVLGSSEQNGRLTERENFVLLTLVIALLMLVEGREQGGAKLRLEPGRPAVEVGLEGSRQRLDTRRVLGKGIEGGCYDGLWNFH